MNIEERLIAWLEFNQRHCEERDLLNDALEELERRGSNQITSVADLVEERNRALGLLANAEAAIYAAEEQLAEARAWIRRHYEQWDVCSPAAHDMRAEMPWLEDEAVKGGE